MLRVLHFARRWRRVLAGLATVFVVQTACPAGFMPASLGQGQGWLFTLCPVGLPSGFLTASVTAPEPEHVHQPVPAHAATMDHATHHGLHASPDSTAGDLLDQHKHNDTVASIVAKGFCPLCSVLDVPAMPLAGQSLPVPDAQSAHWHDAVLPCCLPGHGLLYAARAPPA